MVHRFGRCEDLLLAAGLGVAAGDDHAVVVELVFVDAEPLGVLGAQSCHHGDNVFDHVLAEDGNLLLVVAEAAHAVIAQLDKVLIAHLFGHPVAHMHHPVEDVVQLRLVGLQTPAQDLKALPAGVPVRVLGVFHQHCAGERFAAELKFHAGHQLGVLADKLVLLNHLLHDLLAHGFAADFHGAEQNRGEGLFKLGAERRVEQRALVFHDVIAHLGADFVVIIVFRHIEFICCVDGIAHVGQGGVGVILEVGLQIILSRGEDLLNAVRAADAGDHVLHHSLDLFERYASVGKLGNFHAFPPSFRSRAKAQSGMIDCRCHAGSSIMLLYLFYHVTSKGSRAARGMLYFSPEA